MAGYSQEFLIEVYLSRFMQIASMEELFQLEADAVKLYNRVGKDKFREYASLDAKVIKEYRDA